MAMDDAAGTDRRRLDEIERALREAQHELRALHHRLAELERARAAVRRAFDAALHDEAACARQHGDCACTPIPSV
jgi:uncharacterized coiled-coil DUF342 family protein